MTQQRPMTVGIYGLGTIGREVAARLQAGVHGLTLAGVSAGNPAKAKAWLESVGMVVPVLDADGLARTCDVVLECAPAAVFADIANAAIAHRRIFVPLSVGGLLRHEDLVERARQAGARIIVPTGALLGLDAVRAAAEGTIHSARVITRKPPRGLMGAPYLARHGIDISQLSEPLRVFEGSAREGVAGFPANVNVAAALSLAGIGPDRTMLEIWADPGLDRNTHQIEIEADSARLSMRIENIPSEANPASGRITALSAVACLRGLVASFKVGS